MANVSIPKSSLIIERATIRIYGHSAILMNRMTLEDVEKIYSDKANTVVKKKYANLIPEEDREHIRKAYIDDQDRLYILGRAFKSALVEAAPGLGRKKVSKRSVTQSVRVTADKLVLTKHSDMFIQKDVTRLPERGGVKGAPIVIYRPRIDEWELELPLRFNAAVISVEEVARLVEIAGDTIGVCDWRLEGGGNYGAFGMKPLGKEEKKAA